MRKKQTVIDEFSLLKFTTSSEVDRTRLLFSKKLHKNRLKLFPKEYEDSYKELKHFRSSNSEMVVEEIQQPKKKPQLFVDDDDIEEYNIGEEVQLIQLGEKPRESKKKNRAMEIAENKKFLEE